MHGKPIVQAYFHCRDCRSLLDVPFNSITAWNSEAVTVDKGEDCLLEYKYPGKEMFRYSCRQCGQTMFTTNRYKWRLVSQAVIRKCNADILPQELVSNKHFYYEQRVIDIRDGLPKYLQGIDGPLDEGVE